MATTSFPLSRRVTRAIPRRRRARLPVALAVVMLGAVAAGVAVTRTGDGNGLVGEPAPSFSVPDVRDRAATVAFAPGRPTVVNFFAAWCVPCRDELPVLEQAAQRTAGSVAFVGIDVNDSRSAASDLLTEAGISYPAGYDPDRAVAHRYRLQGMPTTVFVDADGRVADVARGRLTAADLDRRLARIHTAAGVGTP